MSRGKNEARRLIGLVRLGPGQSEVTPEPVEYSSTTGKSGDYPGKFREFFINPRKAGG